ncbi:hypothetical protein HOB85_00705, partial [Candidatus Woesearchaeota archaeon]|nr:hypothetical protein [Candidatus Woesearchaeota archaeon]
MKIERTDDKKLIKLTEQLQQHTPSQRLEQTIEAGGIVIVAHHQPDPDSETRVLSIAELSPTKEENELYLNLIASHPQNPFAHTGFDVLAQARVTAMAEGYTKVRTQYNITDPRLANLFQGKLGFKAEEFLDGLVRATWEITSDRVEGKITG